jgi:hypothetical protein
MMLEIHSMQQTDSTPIAFAIPDYDVFWPPFDVLWTVHHIKRIALGGTFHEST